MLMMLFFLFSCSAWAMQSRPGAKIILTITPSVTYADPDESGNYIQATLSGLCCEKNKMELLQINNAMHSVSGQTYTPDNILQALTEKKIDHYPLHWHKKIQKLQGKVDFYVIRNDEHGKRSVIDLSEPAKKRMLDYLSRDITKKNNDCFKLCKGVALKQVAVKKRIAEHKPLIQYFDVMQEAEFKAGEVVVFFTSELIETSTHLITLKQYAIALSSGMCLSKLDDGGSLYVSDFVSLKSKYKYDGYARMHVKISKRADFMKDPFCRLICRSIVMYLCPEAKHEISFEDGHKIRHKIAGIQGLRYNQSAFRSDIKGIECEIDGHAIKTPQQLFSLVSTGVINIFPLYVQKRVTYMTGEEVLFIKLVDKDNNVKDAGNIPEWLRRKLLTYLQYDGEDKNRQCFDFCKELCLKSYKESEKFDESVSYDKEWSIVPEASLKAGDAIALGIDNSIKHCAVSLGNGMFISKFGNGGFLLVTDLQSMKDNYACTGFALIQPTITKYKKFWQEYKNNFEKSSIQFNEKKDTVVSQSFFSSLTELFM